MAMTAVLRAAHAESCRPTDKGSAVAQSKEAPKDAAVPKLSTHAPVEPTKSASPSLRPGYEG
jgi:hypothetical protein